MSYVLKSVRIGVHCGEDLTRAQASRIEVPPQAPKLHLPAYQAMAIRAESSQILGDVVLVIAVYVIDIELTWMLGDKSTPLAPTA